MTPDQTIMHPFVIDDEGNGDYTWEQASKESWCSGSGTWDDPYIIEDLTIKGSQTTVIQYCIKIKNSNKPFVIKNSVFYNSHAGIELENAHNGILSENNCSDNYIGILVDGNNNWLNANLLLHNSYGIRLDGENNNITQNFIDQQYGDSIYISTSAKNTIIKLNTIQGAEVCLNPVIYGDYSIDMDTSNTLNGKIIYLYVNEKHLSRDNFTNAGQIILGNCQDSIISDRDFDLRFSLARSQNITLKNLTITTPIGLRSCFNFKIINNSLNMISFYNSYYNELTNNTNY